MGASHWLQKHWFVADMILEVQEKGSHKNYCLLTGDKTKTGEKAATEGR